MSMMWRALTARKRGCFQGTLPRFELEKQGVTCDALGAFRHLFGIEDTGLLPITFPHLVAAPLHMEIATRPDFPLPALGLIHMANRITQHRPIPTASALDLQVWIEGHRGTPLGVEFDLHTHALVDGVCCWEEVSTVLSRAVEGVGSRPPRVKPPLDRDVPGVSLELPSNWGRAYAQVSGDWNPIHLHPWTAKPFGFSRHIAHGMALLAKVEHALHRPGEGSVTLSTRFEKPVFLPATVMLQSASENDRTTFVVRGERPHMFGWYGASE